MLSTGEWISLLGFAVSVAVLWGKHQAQMAGLKAEVKETRESDKRQGERIGVLEERVAAIEAVDKDRIRSATGAHPIPRPPHG